MTTSEIPGARLESVPSADQETDYGWLVRVWVLVAAFAAVTLYWSHHVGIPIRDPGGSIFLSRFGISLGFFVPMALIDAALRVGRSGWTWRRTVAMLRSRWTRTRLTLALSALLAYHLVYFCYHNLKSWDVLNQSRDAMLLSWDRWLFLGHSPAVLLHDLLGQHVAAHVLVFIYESFGTIVLVAIPMPIVFATRMRDAYVAITSALWVWIFGVGCYYLIPSLGPFEVAPQEFAGLPHTTIQETQARYMDQRAHLLAHPQAHDAFAQVSAFASLHVGVTTVIFLMCGYYGLRKTTVAMGIFLVATIVATVYWGWHFFVDDPAGLFIGGLACLLGAKMIYPRGRRSRARTVDAGSAQ
ncbi:MAG: phosphoesterase, PA-phosphatase related protein [Marmoricola sp.]|nr:phosphoesterase, PA-phosphatase related protein [Marmoricola sp.]